MDHQIRYGRNDQLQEHAGTRRTLERLSPNIDYRVNGQVHTRHDLKQAH